MKDVAKFVFVFVFFDLEQMWSYNLPDLERTLNAL